MRRIYLFFIAVLACASVVSQPITLSNANMPGNNDTLRYTNVAIPSIGNYTQTGANYTWNFSTITSLTEGVRSFKNAFQTPYAFFFLNSNEYGEKIADTLGVGPLAITKYYNYYRKQTTPVNAFIADGVGMTFNSIPVPSYYSDKDELYNFPMSYPKYDSTTFRFSSLTTSILPISYSKTGYRVTKVDGWGTITTPFGTATCLRLITTQYSKDTVKVALFPIGLINVQRSYQWMTTSSKIPYFEITGSLTAGLFTPTLARYRGFNKSLLTVGINEFPANTGALMYPNPASEKIFIDRREVRNLLVTDALGREVLKLANSTQALDISCFPQGIYFLSFESEDGQETGKFLKE